MEERREKIGKVDDRGCISHLDWAFDGTYKRSDIKDDLHIGL